MTHDNLFLNSLAVAEYQLLQPYLRDVKLSQGEALYENGDSVSRVWFPHNAILSLVVMLSTGETVEAAMVGRDGMVAAFSALDSKVAVNRAIVQLGGTASVCDADAFKRLVLSSPKLLSQVIRHEQAVYVQTQQSAACNVTHEVVARLARWMLRARDLAPSDTMHFTQEFLAEMLGVRRSTVSPAALQLQTAGLIKYRRGEIQILDIDGLQEVSCECYFTIREKYHDLLDT